MRHDRQTTTRRTRFGAAGALLLGALGAGLPAPPPLAAAVMPATPAAALTPAAAAIPTVAVDHRRDDDPAKALRTALGDASSAKRAAQKLEGEARGEALAAVAAQYRRIADNDTFAADGRAEAAFRAGDVLRGLKRLADAESLYNRAVDLGQDNEEGRDFAARGLLELAHMKRRANDLSSAIALYADVGSRFADQRRSAAHAATWTGKLLLRNGERDKAADVLLGFATAWPEYGAEAVRNADLLAVDQAEAGDEAGAQQTVAKIRTVMEPVIAKGGKEAEAVQKALDSMRVTEMLGGY